MSNENVDRSGDENQSESLTGASAQTLESIRGLTDCTRQGILNFFARAAQELSAPGGEQLYEDARLLVEALNGLEAIDGELDRAGVRSFDAVSGREPAVRA